LGSGILHLERCVFNFREPLLRLDLLRLVVRLLVSWIRAEGCCWLSRCASDGTFWCRENLFLPSWESRRPFLLTRCLPLVSMHGSGKRKDTANASNLLRDLAKLFSSLANTPLCDSTDLCHIGSSVGNLSDWQGGRIDEAFLVQIRVTHACWRKCLV
jgi:hypothetical protein